MLTKGAETLPNKVAHDYKALAKFYDAKNYRKGLKNAEKILEQHKDHPQTNAMKALFELGLGQQNKAQITAKLALQKSKMSSMFCWHTYGTVLKQKKKFAQASFCFQQALRFQKDNMQILRETAALQIQVRDHNNHVATRLSILKLKPNMIHNWVAFAVAQHLKGDYQQLFKALISLQNLRASAQMKPIQDSHYQIYKAIAYQDADQFQKSYQTLTKNKSLILDEDVWNQLMYKCCINLKKKQQSNKYIQFLIKKYPENIEYMKQYQKSTELSTRQLYSKIRCQFNSKIAKIYQLCEIQNSQQFRKQFQEFIKPYFQKNLISLFAQIQVIYEKTKFSEIIQQIFLQTEASLSQKNQYPDGTKSKFPSEYLWSIYLLAQHYSRSFATLPKAYEYIKKAIDHTNTVTEFYVIKAQIQYKMHNNLEALKTINEARKTDLADRYMNNICIKFLLKCMKPSLAEDVLKLFMRDEASLYELQNQWYIIQAGKSFLKQRNYSAGLRHLYFVEKQFQDIQANQYDFHTYCIRKWTLKEYLEYINFNDNIYKDKKYMQAAGNAIQNLIEYSHQLQLQKNTPKLQEPKQDEAAKNKKKKKKKNKVNEQQQLTPVQQFRKKIDYFGNQYLQKIKANPWQEALVYAKNVTSAKYTNKQNKKQNKLYSKAFSNSIRVFIHYNKPMMAIRAHKKLLKTQHDPYLNLMMSLKVINFLKSALENANTNELSKQFIKQYLNELLSENGSIQQYYKNAMKQLPDLFNKEIRIKQIELAFKNNVTRQNLIDLYTNELKTIIQAQGNNANSLQIVLYLCHRLQFYGSFTNQLKQQLNSLFNKQTEYFTDWFTAIDKMPASTWGMFWLSDYDIKREQESQKQKVQQPHTKEQSKPNEKPNQKPNEKQQVKQN